MGGATGTISRLLPDAGAIGVVVPGLRNPVGPAFDSKGSLHFADHDGEDFHLFRRMPAGEVEAHALEVHAGQLWFAAQQIPDVLPDVALRMVGQFDPNDGDPRLVRFRITCCAADALRLVTPIDGDLDALAEGDWIEINGQWDGDGDEPGLDVVSWRSIPTPDHPYLTLRDP